jgi:hypothetical protein
MAAKIVSAFLALPDNDKRLLWVSPKDFGHLSNRLKGIPGIQFFDFVDPIERLYVVSDVVITKGTQAVTLECDNLGIPTISLMPGTNPIDELLTPRVKSTLSLNARAVDASTLLYYLQQIFRSNSTSSNSSPLPSDSVSRTTAVLLAEIQRLTGHFLHCHAGEITHSD